MPAFGVYPVADVLEAGEQVSSTYEGRHVTVLESDLIHPTQTDGLVVKGDPVVFGTVGLRAVGIAMTTGLSAGQRIAVDTEGIWAVDVVANNDAGASDVNGGDLLYITTAAPAVVSKINNTATNIPFGYALGFITGGNTEFIAVKVHFDPSLDSQDRMYKTVASGGLGKRSTGLLEAGASEGVGGYKDAQIDGQQTGNTYGWGFWIEPQAGFIGSAHLLVGLDVGMYAHDTADPSLSWVYGFQYMSDWKIAPAHMGVIRVNINQGRVANPMEYIWAFGNPESCGFIAAVTEGDPPVGYVPWANIVGYGTLYIRLYADQD